jgi:N-acetylglutamate synthase-like GNAT family acetyltransferase
VRDGYSNADDLLRAISESAANVLVAEWEGRLAGSIIGAFDGWRGNIYRLAVHPGHRRQGVARALLVEVEKKLTQQGAKRITALVEKDHPESMPFWEAVGYRVDDKIVRRVRNLWYCKRSFADFFCRPQVGHLTYTLLLFYLNFSAAACTAASLFSFSCLTAVLW